MLDNFVPFFYIEHATIVSYNILAIKTFNSFYFHIFVGFYSPQRYENNSIYANILFVLTFGALLAFIVSGDKFVLFALLPRRKPREA